MPSRTAKARPSYRAVFTPEADRKTWTVEIDGKVNGCGCVTWGRSLRQARAHLREALAVALEDDAAASSAEIIEEFRLPRSEDLKALRARREKLEASMRALTEETRDMAQNLHGQGYSLRDVAELVGTSHQRVQQWVAG
jgi:DNA-directed RNA polymerase specialized sigma24 family protein